MPNPNASFPARFTPVSAVAFINTDGATEIVTPALPLPVSLGAGTSGLEPGGVAITGTAMPTGGTGLTGWLSAIYRACISALPSGNNHIGNVFVDDVADNLTVSGSVTSAATVVSSGTTGFGGGAFQVTSAGTTCTISYEQSNDGINWISLPVMSGAASNSVPATTTTIAGLYAFATSAAQVRARVSTYGSGTVAVTLVLKRRPLNVMGTSLAGGSSTLGSVTANTAVGYTDSTTALAASGNFNGTGRNNSQPQYAFFVATAFADVAGTLFVDQSLDSGATYQMVSSVAVAANTSQQLTARITGVYNSATLFRVRYVNGGAAQATFRLSSAFSAR